MILWFLVVVTHQAALIYDPSSEPDTATTVDVPGSPGRSPSWRRGVGDPDEADVIGTGALSVANTVRSRTLNNHIRDLRQVSAAQAGPTPSRSGVSSLYIRTAPSTM
jgi:hypothetical protein